MLLCKMPFKAKENTNVNDHSEPSTYTTNQKKKQM